MRERLLSSRALLGAALSLALLAAACGGDDSSGAAGADSSAAADGGSSDAPAGPISLLIPVVPPTWDTRQVTSFIAGLSVNEPLTTYQLDGSIEEALAATVEQPDATTYVYTLRPGVTFSDGTPLTPDDVKFSFELHMGEDTSSIAARYYTGVTSVEVVGDDQVEITLAEPDPEWAYTVSRTGIVSKANYEAHPDDIGTPAAPAIGTGPYVFADFTPSQSVTLEPNPGYWGQAPAFESVTFATASDDSGRLLALQSGDFDGVLSPPLSQVPAIEGLGNYTSYTTFDFTVFRVIFDTAKAPFDDIHVRKAVAHAINREAILESVFAGHASPTESIVPESVVAGLDGDADVATAYDEMGAAFEFDLDAARAELAQSSVPDGFSIEVPVWASDPVHALVVQVIAQDLAELGIELTPRQVDDNGWYAVFLDHEADGLIVDQWSAGTPEPMNLPRGVLLPGSVGNWSGLDDPAVNDAMAAYSAAIDDPAAQQAALLDVLTATQEQTPYVPLAFLDLYLLGDEDITFPEATPFYSFVPLAQMILPA
jgi:peptide/nickel transport system substrate-binding protein